MFGQATFLLFLVSFDKECSITLTGGDTISVRFLYKEEFDYKPKFKLIFCVNKLPGIKGVDHGIWRRVIVDQLILQPQPPQRDGFAVGSKVPTEQNSLDTRSWVFGGIRCVRLRANCNRWKPPKTAIFCTKVRVFGLVLLRFVSGFTLGRPWLKNLLSLMAYGRH